MPPLGATFLRCAMGPVSYAGQCLIASKVPDGLRELSVASLYGGLRRGIDEVAKQAGIATREVESVLPGEEIRAAVAALEVSQPHALHAWHSHAGHMGGLLKGIAELTVDGRVPDVGLCLSRLAAKVSRDKPLSEPLSELSADVERWQDLVTRCREVLDQGDVIARAYRRRRGRRLVAVVVSALAIAVAATFGLRTVAARSRVEAVLSTGDACAAEKVDGADLGKASSEQRARATAMRNECQERRSAEAAAQAQARARDEEARAATRQREDREAACAALADRVSRGEPSAEDEASAGPWGSKLLRIARGALTPGDLAGPLTLPCADTPSAAVLRGAVAKAMLSTPASWANAEDISPDMRAVLVEHAAEIPDVARQRLAFHAEEASRRALIIGDEAKIARAGRLCQARIELLVDARRGSSCARILDAMSGH